jgi:hypothetical protein
MGKMGLGWDGHLNVTCLRKDGSIKWIEIVDNIVVLEACNYSLGTVFKGATQYSSWYISLFNSNSVPAGAWTYGDIGSLFTEFTDYDEATRVLWDSGAVGSQQLTNSASPAVFTASTGVSDTIYGAMLVNVSTKGDNASPTGILWCATAFGTPRPYSAAEVIRVVYTINSQDV